MCGKHTVQNPCFEEAKKQNKTSKPTFISLKYGFWAIFPFLNVWLFNHDYIKVIIVDFYHFFFVFITVLPLTFKAIEHSVRKYEHSALGRFNWSPSIQLKPRLCVCPLMHESRHLEQSRQKGHREAALQAIACRRRRQFVCSWIFSSEITTQKLY